MYGLVLEGGGAKGAYHMGAHKALLECGIEIGGVAGTSVGALNGAMIVQGDHEKAYDLWHEVSYSKVMTIDDDKIKRWKEGNLDIDDVASLTERVKNIFKEKGIDITPMKELLVKTIDEDKIRNSGKDFGIVTVSLTDLRAIEIYIEDIPKGKLPDYLLASAYFPAFRSDKIDGKRYIDGAFYNNLPINLLKDKGYENLIIVRTHASGVVRKVDLEGLNVIVISPTEDLGRALDFDKNRTRHNLELGYYDGLKTLRELKGEKYYIDALENEKYFTNCLLELEDERIERLMKVLKIEKETPCKRVLFEDVLPKLYSILEGEKESSYEDLFLLLLERLADYQDLKRFKVYTYYELLDLVKKNLDREEDVELGTLDKIIGKMDILSLWGRDEIIKEVGKIIL